MITAALIAIAEDTIRDFPQTQDFTALLMAGATQLIGENLKKAVEDGADAEAWLIELTEADEPDSASATVASGFLRAYRMDVLISADPSLSFEGTVVVTALRQGLDPAEALSLRAADGNVGAAALAAAYEDVA